MVVRPAADLRVVCRDRKRVQRVHADAALEAASGQRSQEPPHLAFLDEIVRALVNMGEAVDPLSGEMGNGRHDLPVFRLVCEIVGESHCVHRRTDQRMVHDVSNPFAEKMHLQVQFFQALPVLFPCLQHLPPPRFFKKFRPGYIPLQEAPGSTVSAGRSSSSPAERHPCRRIGTPPG